VAYTEQTKVIDYGCNELVDENRRLYERKNTPRRRQPDSKRGMRAARKKLRPVFWNFPRMIAMIRQPFVLAAILAITVGCVRPIAAEALPIDVSPNGTQDTTALDDYVAKADPSYRYILHDTRPGEGYTVFALRMTSQQWRSLEEVDRVLWEHDLLIAVPWVPHSGDAETAFLVVNGGRNGDDPSASNDELLGVLAVVTGSVAAMVSQIPNQPLRFADESRTRTEDAILAYGMDKYLRTSDPEWLAHLPMTKAVVRAMDAIQAFTADPPEGLVEPRPIEDFIVAGGSKRGWTSWLVAAVEARNGSTSRVKAILPASIDLLNMEVQFVHHWEAYGFYAPAIKDYVEFDMPCRMGTPESRAMLAVIDPYAYRDRLTMPKLVLNSAGDQFFVPDSSQFYFADLPGPKHLRYTLNTDHSQGQDLWAIVLPALSWLSDARDDKVGPQYAWSLEPDGSIRVETQTEPKRVRLWQAHNPRARDFRLEAIGPAWTSTELEASADGVYIGQVERPLEGWTAYTVELTFPPSTLLPTPLEGDQIYTTDVRVTPDILPYRDTACICWACLPDWGGGWRSILK
jgi:PhoPQ-activated pathogenicity-related protein